jgi:hypothetical protein
MWSLLYNTLTKSQHVPVSHILHPKLIQIMPTILEYTLLHFRTGTTHQNEETNDYSLIMFKLMDQIFHLLMTQFSEVFQPSLEQYVAFLRALFDLWCKCFDTLNRLESQQHIIHIICTTLKHISTLTITQQNQKKVFTLVVDRILQETIRIRYLLTQTSLITFVNISLSPLFILKFESDPVSNSPFALFVFW